jgi:hypothetical protein
MVLVLVHPMPGLLWMDNLKVAARPVLVLPRAVVQRYVNVQCVIQR